MIYIPAIISVIAVIGYLSLLVLDPRIMVFGLIHYIGLFWFVIAWIFLIFQLVLMGDKDNEKEKKAGIKHKRAVIVIVVCYVVVFLGVSQRFLLTV
jgi:hypothetical protein